MNEHEWQTCTDWSKMFDIVRASKEQLLQFYNVDDRSVLTKLEWCDRIREIWGNPWKPFDIAFSVSPSSIMVGTEYVDVTLINPSICTWNNGAIPKTAKAIHDGERVLCKECNGVGSVRNGGVRSSARRVCLACDERGYTQSEPDWSAMPVLADMLEESGMTIPEILEHLRRVGGHTRNCWVLQLLMGT